MKRPTITDIAREAGVSKGAVSYALNGRPGVSEATRHRITRIARELGWSPSSTARALSGGRTGAIGLVLDRSPDVLGVEPFLTALLARIERELLLQVVPGVDAELAVYRRWRAEHKVDGVLLAGPACAAELPRIGLPAVALGGPLGHPQVPSVWVDDTAAADEVLSYLAALGHREVVRLAAPAPFAHPETRAAAFTAAADRLGLTEVRTVQVGRLGAAAPGPAVPGVAGEGRGDAGFEGPARGLGIAGTGHGAGPAAGASGERSGGAAGGRFGSTGPSDHHPRGASAGLTGVTTGHSGTPGAVPRLGLVGATAAHPAEPATAAAWLAGVTAVHAGEAGAGAARRVLSGARPPTALVCDTDVLAVAALAAARELGLAVPGDVSVVSWEDSDLCRLVRPALSAVWRPLAELGGLAAAVLEALLAGEDVGDVCASRPKLVTRGSTGRPRRRG
ncbi:LacI family DNA-binding transcriptional regulator [Amycolatopsis sp. cmx-4-68]|uniref:LacI family DNA-binding transcriptional regulator n=1 Tax=Amycolatopsis sp. cmx-4-68 TaxID=2790938 RepID=UPI00397AEF1D